MNIRTFFALLLAASLVGCGGVPRSDPAFYTKAAADTQAMDTIGFCAGAQKGSSKGMEVRLNQTSEEEDGAASSYKRVDATKSITCAGH